MITSDKAMKELEKLADYYGNDIEDWEIGIYIKQQEQLQAEHEALKRDVARYFELKDKKINHDSTILENKEFYDLRDKLYKLSKVGNEE